MNKNIFTRPKRKVNKVYIHCSDSDRSSHDNVDTIRGWHKERGWSDIGYHFFINKGGSILEGRDIERIPSAQKGHNTGSIAICVSGKSKFTQDQFDSLFTFCKQISKFYNGKITFHGHCEVSHKKCPVFDYKTVLNLDKTGNITYYDKTISNFTTQPQPQLKKKMSFTLLALAAPLIKKLAIKGFDKLKNKSQEVIIKKILDKTGITGINLGSALDTQYAQNQVSRAMNDLSPEKLLELKKEIIESETELRIAEAQYQAKQVSVINQTMKAEIKADDSWQRKWRPFNGFMFAITMAITLISYLGLGGASIYLKSPEMLKMLSELIFSTSPLILGWSAVLGVSSYTRGKEKLEKLKRIT